MSALVACPHCGQQIDAMNYISGSTILHACGALVLIMHAAGGQTAATLVAAPRRTPAPRRRGVRRG